MGEETEIVHSNLNMASYGFGKFLTEFVELDYYFSNLIGSIYKILN